MFHCHTASRLHMLQTPFLFLTKGLFIVNGDNSFTYFFQLFLTYCISVELVSASSSMLILYPLDNRTLWQLQAVIFFWSSCFFFLFCRGQPVLPPTEHTQSPYDCTFCVLIFNTHWSLLHFHQYTPYIQHMLIFHFPLNVSLSHQHSLLVLTFSSAGK